MHRRLVLWLAAGFVVTGMALHLRAQQEAQPPGPDEVTIPEGTEFKLQLHSTINSRNSKPGDRVLTTLLDPVAVEDRDVLPKGIRVDGHIGEVRPAGRRGKGGYVTLVFDTVELRNGQKVAILGSLTEVFSGEGGGNPNVGAEGELKGGGPSRKVQGAVIVGSAAAGAAAGLGPGIAVGAAGVMAAVLLPHGKQAALGAGSLIGMRLDRDVTLTLPAAGTLPAADSSKTPHPSQNLPPGGKPPAADPAKTPQASYDTAPSPSMS
jgi:hypothetical protein